MKFDEKSAIERSAPMAELTTRDKALATATGAEITSEETVDITTRVRERYAAAARRVSAGAGCCAPAGAEAADAMSTTDAAGVSRGLYAADEVAALPEEAVLASLGCGNPTALIDLRLGETVL